MATATKKRNAAADFWKLFLTIATAWMHFNARGLIGTQHLIPYLGTPDVANPPFFRGALILTFFLIIGGYFMAAGYASRKRKGLIDPEHASKAAFTYTAGRFKGLWPAYFMGSLVGYIIICAVNGYSPAQWFNALMVNVWEFTGLRDMVFCTFTPMVGINPQMVEAFSYPLWYISSILISAPIMYYLMVSNEERWRALWCPFFTIAWLFSYGVLNYAANRAQFVLGLPANVLWIIGGHCMGCLIYYFVEFLKQKEFSDGAKLAIGIVNMLCSVWLIYAAATNYYQWHMENYMPTYFRDDVYIPFMVVILVCTMLNVDFFTKIINQSIFSALGEYSLYFFVVHWPITRLEAFLGTEVFPLNSYWAHLALFFAITAVIGALAMFVAKKWLQPWITGFLSPAPAKEQAA